MLVEGSCTNGHELVCSVREGRLRGVYVKSVLRVTCPRCGADIVVDLEGNPLTIALPSSRREAG